MILSFDERIKKLKLKGKFDTAMLILSIQILVKMKMKNFCLIKLCAEWNIIVILSLTITLIKMDPIIY